MKISYNWLRQYIETEKNPSEIAGILTNIGLEVENMEEWLSVDGGLEGIVIGEVVLCEPHPDADKLTVTKVDIGDGKLLDIVCGAPNVDLGQKVPVATTGTLLRFGGKEVEIKRSRIRGQVSEGMICAEDELGLGSSHEGIMILPGNIKNGTAGADYFKIERDTIFEIGLTPNRIDGASHFGVARDLAAYLNQKEPTQAVIPGIESFSIDNTNNKVEVTVENQADCPRYSGLTISNLTVTESPGWLLNRLRSIGLTPINNVVDITNYVLHEIGQPLHAFDADKISGGRVIVKNLPDKTKFITLDETERELSSKDLMICDSKGGMCIGGVFGGTGSGVTGETKSIFLESAYFNPVSIRKSARRHDLNTDASFRFERGSDPSNTIWALKRAATLIKELAGGEISSDIVDIYPVPVEPKKVNISYSNISRLIGKELGKTEIRNILTSLDFDILSEDDLNIVVSVATYRIDVSREADVIEEILRIYGYNNIEIDNRVNSTLTYIEKPDKERVVNTISDMLSGMGFMEIMSNSLTQASLYEDNPDFDYSKLVLLANPLSLDLNAMRQTMLYGGLGAVERNINRQSSNLRFYEFGNIYKIKKQGAEVVSDYSEKFHLDLFTTGNQSIESWINKPMPTDFYHMKSTVNMVLEKAGINIQALTVNDATQTFFSEGLQYSYNNEVIASFGKLGNTTTRLSGIKQDVFYATIDWNILMGTVKSNKISFTELPKYPAVRRDLALLVDKSVKFSDLKDLALRSEKHILRDVDLFDVYEDQSLGTGKKSYALSFILRDDKRTLTDKMIDKVMKNLIRVYTSELNAVVR